MAFHFKKKEKVAKALRRICCERVEDALEILKDDRLKAVHNVRKEIKKLRAILRLIRGEIGKNVYRRNNHRLRAAAGELTAVRDARVRLDAFEGLAKHFGRGLPARPFPKIEEALREDYRAEERKFLNGHSAGAVAKILLELKQHADDLKTDASGWAAIGPGLEASFCRGREAFKTVQKDCSPKNLHEWRKRVKDLWHHLRLLCRVWPKEVRATIEELETLAELLGNDHDLVMLAEFVAENFKGARDAEALAELIGRRQKEFRSEALKLGRRFYAEKPERFCRRIGNYWTIWRGEK